MAAAQKLYPRGTVKRIVKAHSNRNVSKNADILVRCTYLLQLPHYSLASCLRSFSTTCCSCKSASSSAFPHSYSRGCGGRPSDPIQLTSLQTDARSLDSVAQVRGEEHLGQLGAQGYRGAYSACYRLFAGRYRSNWWSVRTENPPQVPRVIRRVQIVLCWP